MSNTELHPLYDDELEYIDVDFDDGSEEIPIPRFPSLDTTAYPSQSTLAQTPIEVLGQPSSWMQQGGIEFPCYEGSNPAAFSTPSGCSVQDDVHATVNNATVVVAGEATNGYSLGDDIHGRLGSSSYACRHDTRSSPVPSGFSTQLGDASAGLPSDDFSSLTPEQLLALADVVLRVYIPGEEASASHPAERCGIDPSMISNTTASQFETSGPRPQSMEATPYADPAFDVNTPESIPSPQEMGLYFLQSKSGNIGGFDDGDFQAFEEGPRNDLGMPRGDDRRPGSTDSQDSALSAQNDVSPFAPETASATPHGMNHQTQPIGMSEFQKHTARTREVSRAHTQLELQCHPEPLMDSRMMNYAQRDVHHPSGAINLQRAQSQDGARSLGMRPYTLPVKQPQPRYSMPAPILGSGHLHETVPYHANRFPFPSHPRPEQVPSSSTPLGHPPHHGVTMSYPSYPAPPYPPPAPLPQFQHPHAASPADHPADVAPAVAAAPTITASRGVKRRREEPDADPFETFVNFTGEIVRLHNEQTHPSSISCLVTGCQTQFTPKASKGEWTNHLVNMHGYSATDPVCCHVCKKPKAMKLESLGRHYTTKHLSLAKSQCPICLTSGYSRVDSMKRHIRQERCDEQQRHAGRVEKLRRLQGQVGALSFEDIRDLYPLP